MIGVLCYALCCYTYYINPIMVMMTIFFLLPINDRVQNEHWCIYEWLNGVNCKSEDCSNKNVRWIEMKLFTLSNGSYVLLMCLPTWFVNEKKKKETHIRRYSGMHYIISIRYQAFVYASHMMMKNNKRPGRKRKDKMKMKSMNHWCVRVCVCVWWWWGIGLCQCFMHTMHNLTYIKCAASADIQYAPCVMILFVSCVL